MALSPFQRRICRLLAEVRRRSGESYVAGGAALGEALGSLRISRDIDLFHDADEALHASVAADRAQLVAAGLDFRVVHERRGFVEAEIRDGEQRLLLQWARDSAFRFLPLVEHPDFGLTLHPLDLATNKLLAAVGRLEVRDWVDLVESCARLQPLGYLAWAACAKDPGFNPRSILEQAARGARYSQAELEELEFDGPPPELALLSERWHAELDAARAVVGLLPASEIGTLVLVAAADVPLCASPAELPALLAARAVRFHRGCLRGAWPELR